MHNTYEGMTINVREQTMKELTRLLSNRKTIYDFFTDHCRLLLPDYRVVGFEYMYKLMSGQKKAVHIDEVSKVEVDKIVVTREKMQNYCLENEKLRDFTPDEAVDRDFIIKLIAILDPEMYRRLSDASRARAASCKKLQRRMRLGKMINVCPEYSKLLLMVPSSTRLTTFGIAPKLNEYERRPEPINSKVKDMLSKNSKANQQSSNNYLGEVLREEDEVIIDDVDLKEEELDMLDYE